ncbi:hypothetical protein GJAV_G00039050 [Gymnothorax javanicus]|nr:hypothetical protein GJAV_G00039050 [Gymnothorax javanicus]
MNMHFTNSSSVTLLFQFWDVRGPAGMLFSVVVVLLLTVVYELLKVWKIRLDQPLVPRLPHPPSPATTESVGSSIALDGSLSELPFAPPKLSPAPEKRWPLQLLQTWVHIGQVTLGYLLMLCVMTYNVWIFLGVIVGSFIGYFLSFPFLEKF